MEDVVKRRLIGAAVLVAAGVFIPVMLVKLAQPSAPPEGASVRVYEITPSGETRAVSDSEQQTDSETDQSQSEQVAQNDQEEQQQERFEPEEEETLAPQSGRSAPPEPESSESEPPPEPASEPEPRPAPESKPAPKPEPQPEPKPAPKPEPKPAPKPAPEPQPDRSAASSEDPYFVVQVGSFGEESNAIGMMQKLRRDFPVFYREGEVGGNRLYRVRVGPYDSREAAQIDETRLKQNGYKTQILTLP